MTNEAANDVLHKVETNSPFVHLRRLCDREWPAIAAAQTATIGLLDEIDSLELPAEENTSLVLFGSVGRAEVTKQSDLDWSILIDGQSDPEHLTYAHQIDQCLARLNRRGPGTTATFGGLTSSHELIHNVGGVHDTNLNLTRRMLLLLESRAVNNTIVHERVIRGILSRYIVCDRSVAWNDHPVEPLTIVPRFLLNDFTRYWRTIAVDYAAKRWEQSEKKWAIRNAKLRMSRKLLFVAGLLLCFSFKLYGQELQEDMLGDIDTFAPSLANFLLPYVKMTPLELLMTALVSERCSAETIGLILDSYDRFLAILDDRQNRDHLEDLKFDTAATDPLFSEIRKLSHDFQSGLDRLFYVESSQLPKLIRKYGVF